MGDDRLWVPTQVEDEGIAMRDTPSEWIGRAVGDRWILQNGSYFGDEEDGDGSIFIAPGDVIEFSTYRRSGEVDVEICADGTYRLMGAAPDGDTFSIGWGEATGGNIAACIQEYIETASDDPDTITVDVGWWGKARCRFVVDAAGPRFEEVGGDRG